MKVAIIDCGTNTFNLLVAEIADDKSWRFVFQTTHAVKLSPSSHNKNIGFNRIARGIDALRSINNSIINFHCDKTFAFATSGIREAENGEAFLKLAKEQIGIDIHIIDGNEEAEIIYKGVKRSFEMNTSPHLIIDIGGGSVEIIIANQENIFWKKSFEIGVSRIKGKFHFDDPISNEQIDELNTYYETELEELKTEIEKHQPKTLIGSAGSFDSFALMNSFKDKNTAGYITHPCAKLDIQNLNELLEELISKSLSERIVMKGIKPMRAEMIAIASILVKYILQIGDIKKVYQSSYALKEGVIEKIIANPSWMENTGESK